MAAKNNINNEWQPEKIIINAGLTFGSAMGFVIVGAILGAAAAVSVLNKNAAAPAATERETALRETEKGAARLRNRLSKLSSRFKDLAGRAREAATIVNENVRPAWNDAVAEGKAAAKKTEEELRAEVEANPS